jgi:hypothetical protein
MGREAKFEMISEFSTLLDTSTIIIFECFDSFVLNLLLIRIIFDLYH